MLKVIKILKIEPYIIYCQLSNEMVTALDMDPLFEKHSHLKGIEKLRDFDTFQKAKIGLMGEVYWEKIIHADGIDWNYDISPEYFLQEGKTIIFV